MNRESDRRQTEFLHLAGAAIISKGPDADAMQPAEPSPFPEPSTLPALDRSLTPIFIAVGALVFAFMLYLVIDWLRARAAKRKFEEYRRQTREKWEQEQQELDTGKKTDNETGI